MVAGNIQPGGMGFQQLGYLAGFPQRQAFPVAGVNPGATAVDNVLAVFPVPVGTFDTSGSNRGFRIAAYCSITANANAKAVKIIVNPTAAVVGSTITGGTTLATSGALGATITGVFLEAMFLDLIGINNQLGFGLLSWSAIATAVTLITSIAPVAISGDETNPILIAVTGNAGTAVADIALNYFDCAAVN
jgi:hypothetical protein